MITLRGLLGRWKNRWDSNFNQSDTASDTAAFESSPPLTQAHSDMDIDPELFTTADELSSHFAAVRWAQIAITDLRATYDIHCDASHNDVFECDYLCLPKSVEEYLNSLNENNLRALFIVAFKAWYWRQYIMMQWATRHGEINNDKNS